LVRQRTVYSRRGLDQEPLTMYKLLSQETFDTLLQAKLPVEQWELHCSQACLHCALACQPRRHSHLD